MKEEITTILKSIGYYLSLQNKANVRRLLYRDLKFKIEQNLQTRTTFKRNMDEFDLAIFCMVKPEYDALLSVFEFISKGTKEYKNINNLRVWKKEIGRSYGLAPLRVLFIPIGECGNISCTRACIRVFDNFKIKNAILVGIAAGIESKIKKYSVVFSEGVVDYENQRLESTGITYRPDPIPVDPSFIRTFQYIYGHLDEWKKELKSKIDHLKMSIPSNINIDLLEMKPGIIASGSKLFADGTSLDNLAKVIVVKKGIISGEMEGSGFTQSCQEFNIPWLVIRGISDYGGIDKNEDENKRLQILAALSASTLLKVYLQNVYRTRDEIEDF